MMEKILYNTGCVIFSAMIGTLIVGKDLNEKHFIGNTYISLWTYFELFTYITQKLVNYRELDF